jgi:hypothetical protein
MFSKCGEMKEVMQEWLKAQLRTFNFDGIRKSVVSPDVL